MKINSSMKKNSVRKIFFGYKKTGQNFFANKKNRFDVFDFCKAILMICLTSFCLFLFISLIHSLNGKF